MVIIIFAFLKKATRVVAQVFCVSACMCVSACVRVSTITRKENSWDEFNIGHCAIKVKVTVAVLKFSPFPKIQTIKSYN